MSDQHLIGTQFDDVLFGADGNDWLEGLGGNDTLFGAEGADLLEGGAGSDLLDGGTGSDTFVFGRGDGADWVNSNFGSETDRLQLGAGITLADVSVQQMGSSVQLGLSGNAGDRIGLGDYQFGFGYAAEIRFAGGASWDYATVQRKLFASDDFLLGTDASETLDGGLGNDILIGGDGDDTLYGDDGFDQMNGGFGADTYVFGRGDGQDAIMSTTFEHTLGEDRLQLGAGITIADVEIARSGDNLTLRIAGSADSVLVVDYFVFGNALAGIEFAGGGAWDAAAVNRKLFESDDFLQGGAGADTLDGGLGDDFLNGGGGNDVLYGDAGDDMMSGGAGADTYVFGRGDGRDTVSDFEPLAEDRVLLGSGISLADVSVERVADDLLLGLEGTREELRVNGYFLFGNQLSTIDFADGGSWDGAAVQRKLVSSDDLLIGTQGTDTLDGGLGNDQLFGGDGNDVLYGDAGTDYMDGGFGVDTYVFGRGDGFDWVASNFGSEADRVQLGHGITLADVAVQQLGSSVQLELSGNAGDRLGLGDYQFGFGYAPEIRFAGGASWDYATVQRKLVASDDFLQGTDANETLDGGLGNDFLNGGAGDDILYGDAGSDAMSGGFGADTYVFGRGDGQDFIHSGMPGASMQQDRLQFGSGITLADVQVSQEFGNLVLDLGAGDRLTLVSYAFAPEFRLGSIEFTDGSRLDEQAIQRRLVASDDFLQGTDAADTLDGGLGNDFLNGGRGNDVLYGGAGDDLLGGGDGADVYLFGRGDGADRISTGDVLPEDRVQFAAGISLADVTVAQVSGFDLRLQLEGTGDTLTVVSNFAGLSQISFTDGGSWDEAAVQRKLVSSDDLLIGTQGTDTLDGGLGNDQLFGGDGNDVLYGDAGTDYMDGGFGVDTYVFGRGDGFDWVASNFGSEADRVQLGHGITLADVAVQQLGSSVQLELSGNAGDRLGLGDYQFGFGYAPEIRFAGGASWDYATVQRKLVASDDFLQGTDANETLDGGLGNDFLNGGAGDDILYGDAGSDAMSGGFGADTYVFGRGDGQDFIHSGMPGASMQQDRLQFGSGITLADVQVSQEFGNLVLDLGAGDRLTLVSYAFAPEFRLGSIEFTDGSRLDEQAIQRRLVASDDFLQGTDAADTLDGGLGNDFLNGGRGNDVLYGGAGDDLLGGGDGADVYLFGRGDGADRISTGDVLPEDRVQFAAGISLADVTVAQVSGFDLRLQLEGTGDTLTVVSNFAGLSQISFTDGGSWDEAAVQRKLVSSDDLLIGTQGTDTLDGGLGNDQLFGGDGNDVLYGDAGTDYMDGGFGVDTYVFGRGDGFDWVASNFGSEADRVQLGHGITLADVAVQQLGSSVQLELSGNAGDRLGLGDYQFGFGYAPEIRFAGGASWDYATVQRKLVASDDFLQGTDANETLDGGLGNDFLNGGAGDDILYGDAGSDAMSGGFGADTYVFGRGDGQDFIHSGMPGASMQQDRLQFGSGITLADVQVSQEFGNLVLDLGAGDRLTLVSYAFAPEFRLGSIEFTDGSRLDEQAIQRRLVASDDFLQGTDAADTLDGGLGNDFLNGGAGGDILHGGAGDDWMAGGSGKDTYVFGRGDGHDTIGAPSDVLAEDRIQLGSGISLADVSVERVADDLLLGLEGTPEELRVNGYFLFGNQLSTIDFADGGSWDEAAVQRKLVSSDDLLIGTQGTDTLDGGLGNDQLFGGDGNDVLYGDAGTDYMDGGFGVDTYVFGRGDGFDWVASNFGSEADRVQLGHGITLADVAVQQLGSSVQLELSGNAGDRLGLGDYQFGFGYAPEIRFAGGASWDYATVQRKLVASDDFLQGTDANETLDGGLGNDFLNGGAGDDILYGDAGSDAMSGGFGADTYVFGRGDGQDFIHSGGPGESLDADRLQFGSDIAVADVVVTQEFGNLVLTLAGSADRITVVNHFLVPEVSRLNEFRFGDGTVLTAAQIEALLDANDAPVVANPVADQTVQEDVAFAFTLPADAFADPDSGDVLTYSARLPNGDPLPAWLAFDAVSRTFAGTPPAGAGGTVSVRVTATDPDGLSVADDFDFAVLREGTITGTEGGDTLTGTVGRDAIFGLGGDDFLFGVQGDDRLFGGEGSDQLVAHTGNDRLDGGGGDDQLYGGQGSDVYIFARGSGADFAWELAAGDPGDFDIVEVAADIMPWEIAVTYVPSTQTAFNDGGFLLQIMGSADSMKLVWSPYTGAENEIEQVVFMGTPAAWGEAELAALAIQNGAAPVVVNPVADQVVNEDSLFLFILPANTFDDNEIAIGDALTYSVSLADGSALPSWLSFGTFGFLSGTPGNDDVGTISVRITATDLTGRSATDVFDIAVANTNDAPVLVSPIADQRAQDAVAFSFTVPAGTFADVDAGDTLTYSATLAGGGALPSWLTFNAATRTFSGTPAPANIGSSLNVEVKATDSAGAPVSDVFTLNVDVAPDQTIIGTGGNDTLAGASGNDTIDGLGGADSMAGGLGNDTYFVDSAFDRVVEAVGAGIDTVISSAQQHMLDQNVENLTLTGTSSVTVGLGNALDNTIVGSGGKNFLDGRGGADTLIGGAGDDTYMVENAADTIVELAGEGMDDVQSFVSYTLGENVENLTLLGTALAGTGNDADNAIVGNDGNNTLAGRGGSDILDGGPGGDDVYELDAGGSDVVWDFAGDDEVRWHGVSPAQVERIRHTIWSSDSDNLILRAAGTFDSLTLGNYFYPFGDPSSQVERVVFDDGTVWDADELGALRYFGTAGDEFMLGTEWSERLVGFGGSDSLDGGPAGDDVFELDAGGSDEVFDHFGDDEVRWHGVSAAQVERLRPPSGSDNSDDLILRVAGTTDTLTLLYYFLQAPSGSYNPVERVVFDDGTVWGADELGGLRFAPVVVNPLADQAATEDAPFQFVVPADAFDDADIPIGDSLAYGATLVGGGALPSWLSFDTATRTFSGTPLNSNVGAISVQVTATDESGRSASDVFVLNVANTNDAPTLAASIADQSAQDTVAFSFTVPAGTFADVDAGDSLTYSAALAGGGQLPTWLSFNAATRTFTGMPGAAQIGSGIDIQVKATDASGAPVSDVFRLTVGAAPDRTLTGTSGNDTLSGASGNDTLNGLGGADNMTGGLGNDTYFVDNAGDQVNEAANGGIDTVNSSITYTLGNAVENLTLTGTASRNGTGNALANILTGNSGTNALTGRGGDDTYFVDTGDTVTELAGEGDDTIYSSNTRTLSANVEALILAGSSALDGTGNSAANLLRGNAAVNSLQSSDGVDILEGGGGDDTLRDISGNGLLNGGAGADSLTGGSARELYIGGTGNDGLTTGSGADIIAFNAGDGQDTVAASTGNDNSLSLGGGIAYANLFFSKSGNSLVLSTGGTDRVTFTNWYSSTSNRSVLNLQVVAEAMAGYVPGGSDPLLDQKVERFNFQGLASAFDAARTANPGLSSWALSSALLQNHLGGSDMAAIGGDLAYRYGLSGSLAGIGFTPAQQILGSTQFGTQAQALQDPATLQQGAIRLG